METIFREQLDWLDEAREAVFCRDYDRPDMDSRLPGESRLPQPLVDSIVRQPVPIGLNRLHALRRSSPGHDLYLWLAYRTSSLALPWAQVYARHGPFPEKAGDNLTIRNRREKVSPGTEEIQARLARTEILDRAMAAHSSRTRRRRSPVSAGPAPTLGCASDASAVLPAPLLVTAGPPAFPTRLPAPSSARALVCLQPLACRLVRWTGAIQPPERSRSPDGAVCQHALPMPPSSGPALGSASSSRCRVWPLPPVPGERQTLTNP